MKKTQQSEFPKSDSLNVKEERLQCRSSKQSVSSSTSFLSHNSSKEPKRRQSCVGKLSDLTLASPTTPRSSNRQRRFKINIPNGEMLVMDGNQSVIVSAVDDPQKSTVLLTPDIYSRSRRTSLINAALPQKAMTIKHTGSLSTFSPSQKHFQRKSSCFVLSSKFESIRKIQAKEKFVRAVHHIQAIIRPFTATKGFNEIHSHLKHLQMESTTESSGDVTFDPSAFKVKKEKFIPGREFRAIFSTPAGERSQLQCSKVQAVLQTLSPFNEYPIHVQNMICLYSYFSELGSNRTIIRQNHRPEYFYWILAGTAIITTVDSFGITHTQGIVTAGKTVDENALLLGKPRPYTITSQGKVSLLAMEKDDYIQHCHENLEKGEPSHIAYCRRVSLFQDFDMSVLHQSQQTAVLHYFRRGTAIVFDSKQSEWLYIVKTGSCQVLQKVKQVKSNLTNRQESHDDNLMEHEGQVCTDESQSPKRYKSHLPTQRANASDKDKVDTTDVPQAMSHRDSDMAILPKSIAAKPPKSPLKSKSIFIQLDTLKPRDTFGFAELVFDDCPSVSLVSNGAECVMIQKRLFVQHMTHAIKQRLLQEVKLYPPSDALQQKLQDQANWEAFKQKTLTDVLVLSKCKSKEKTKNLFHYSFVDRL